MIASLGRETYNWRLLADIPGGRGGGRGNPAPLKCDYCASSRLQVS